MAGIKKPEKVEKTWKKVLTNGGRGGILTKLSGAEPVGEIKSKSFLKNLKKVLDKSFSMCYLNKVAADAKRIGCQKTLKKVLDKRNEVWYDKQASPNNGVYLVN